MVFHVFGDSHAEWGWSKINKVKTHPLYSTLCYSFGRDKLERLNIASPDYEVKAGDTVCFIFGEIDCSCHVHKYISESKSYKEIIEDIVNKYFIAIKLNVEQIDNLTVYVCSIPPAVIKSTVYYEPDENGRTWIQHRFLGSDEERKEYVLYYNAMLKKYCNIYNYNFFDIHDKYQDKNGFLNRELSCPSVHIKDPIYIEKFIIDNNIILD